MRRDPELIRELMLKLEAADVPPGGWLEFYGWDEEFAVEGKSADEIDGHLFMIFDDGLAFHPFENVRYADGKWTFNRLSPRGHDFVEAVRDPDTWKRTKATASSVGNWSLGILVEIAKNVVRQKLASVLGIPV